jgi:hypothetical protein
MLSRHRGRQVAKMAAYWHKARAPVPNAKERHPAMICHPTY